MVDKMVAYARKQDALRALSTPPAEKTMSPGDRFIDDLVQYDLEETALRNLAHPFPREFKDKAREALDLFEVVVGRYPSPTELLLMVTDPRWREELVFTAASIVQEKLPPAPEHVGGYRQLAGTAVPTPSAPLRRRWWHFWRR